METPAGGGDDDRLSDLPDILLEDMLSRLTSRQAVRTSVLSRRWRHLWRAVRCVDIDQREFFQTSSAMDVLQAPDPGLAIVERTRRMQDEWDALEDLADALLSPSPPTQQGHAPPPPPLDAVRLRFAAVNVHAARRWVRRGLRRRPAAFHLRCDNGDYIDSCSWPVFPSPTLRHELHAGARLRTLHLSGLTLARGFADDVAAGCPVLENLQLHDCCLHGISRLASRSLRTLLMDGCRPEWVPLAAPRVVELRVHGRHLVPVPAPVTPDPEGEMQDLVTAALTCTSPGGAMGLLGTLRHARNLSLTAFSAAAFHGGGGFPVFRNLRALLLERCDVGAACEVLRRFLGSCPRLERLSLRNCMFGDYSYSDSYWSIKQMEASPAKYDCSNLKSIELEFVDGTAAKALYDTLRSISKEIVQPIHASVHDGNRKVKISFA